MFKIKNLMKESRKTPQRNLRDSFTYKAEYVTKIYRAITAKLNNTKGDNLCLEYLFKFVTRSYNVIFDLLMLCIDTKQKEIKMEVLNLYNEFTTSIVMINWLIGFHTKQQQFLLNCNKINHFDVAYRDDSAKHYIQTVIRELKVGCHAKHKSMVGTPQKKVSFSTTIREIRYVEGSVIVPAKSLKALEDIKDNNIIYSSEDEEYDSIQNRKIVPCLTNGNKESKKRYSSRSPFCKLTNFEMRQFVNRYCRNEFVDKVVQEYEQFMAKKNELSKMYNIANYEKIRLLHQKNNSCNYMNSYVTNKNLSLYNYTIYNCNNRINNRKKRNKKQKRQNSNESFMDTTILNEESFFDETKEDFVSSSDKLIYYSLDNSFDRIMVNQKELQKCDNIETDVINENKVEILELNLDNQNKKSEETDYSPSQVVECKLKKRKRNSLDSYLNIDIEDNKNMFFLENCSDTELFIKRIKHGIHEKSKDQMSDPFFINW